MWVGQFRRPYDSRGFVLRQTVDTASELESLDRAQMDAIDAAYGRLGRSHYEVLGVPPESDRPQLRTAYFEQMKRFHPEVFWDRDLGLYRPRVEAIFQGMTAAFETLCDPRRRAAYDLELARASAPPRAVVEGGSIKSTGVMRKATSSPATERATPAPPAPAPASMPPPHVPSLPAPPMPAQANAREVTLHSLMRMRQEQALQRRRELVAELVARADQAELRGERPELIDQLRRAVELTPGDAGLKRRLEAAEELASSTLFGRLCSAARIHEKDGRWESAAEAWARASGERPRELTPLLGVAYASCEGVVHLKRAAEYARRATTLDPKSADAFALLGRVFLLAGLSASAVGAVESALRLDAAHPLANALARQLKLR